MNKNTGVKVTVDYYKGAYTVVGIYNNKILSVSKPITGVDKDGYFKRNFSNRLIWRRRNQMKRKLEEIHEECPEFNFSKKLIKNVDPLLYKSLEYWDKMTGTDYATDYLKTMVQDYDRSKCPHISKSIYEERCQKARKKELKKHKINISYDVALFKTSRRLSLLDRIRGIIIAKKQEKFASVKVKKSIFMKERFLSLDIESLKKAPAKIMKQIDLKQNKTLKKEGQWTRKIESEKDSIRNKKYIHNERAKKFLVNGAITLLAAGTIFNANLINQLKSTNYDIPITEPTTESDKNSSEIDDNSNLYSDFDFPDSTKPIVNPERNYGMIDEDSEINSHLEFLDNGEVSTQDDNSENEKKIQELTFEVEENEASVEGSQNTGITFEVEEDEKSLEKSSTEKSDEQTIEEFKQNAFQKCLDSFIIGEKPKINILDNQIYYENMDRSGNIGYFSTHPDSMVGRIFIKTEDGKFEKIETEGMSLSDALSAFPKCKDYYIQFAKESEMEKLNASDYRGYIDKAQLEQLIQNKLNSIVESTTAQNLDLDSDDWSR